VGEKSQVSNANSNNIDTFNCRQNLSVNGQDYQYFDLRKAEENGLDGVSRLPFSLKVILENLLRHEDGHTVNADDIRACAKWLVERRSRHEIAYHPARVLMQDFTGVPAVVDLAAMRDGMLTMGGDPKKINPQTPVDLVIDHSVMVDEFGSPAAFDRNVEREYERNMERYEFLSWGSKAFDNFRVVPPGTGICHQVNLEHLSKTVWTREVDGVTQAFPDTLVGTDSHTTMVNGLSVLGWGVGGIEAEAAMLGQPVSMLIPEVVGVRLVGKLTEGVTATDLVLRIVEMLREHGVVGKFVEYFGAGLDHLSLEDQATIANMAPEYGATCGFFPIDADTISYLRQTGRGNTAELVEVYAKAQGMWREADSEPAFTDVLELDLAAIKPAISGPKRPQDRIDLDHARQKFTDVLASEYGKSGEENKRVAVSGTGYDLGHGDVMIAAITSCTNTSNPSVLIAAGLLARNAVARDLKIKPWVKTSLAPGSQVVTDYLEAAGLNDDLDTLGFNLVGYGCTTCIGNSGPLAPALSEAINTNDLVSCSVLSGNRNFEGRIGADIKANFLASPPLVVAYAIAGSMLVDIANEPLGNDKDGNPVYLRDIWPSNKEVAGLVREAVKSEMFAKRYGDVFSGDERWQAVDGGGGLTYGWKAGSTYIQNPPYFADMKMQADEISDIGNARILGVFADSITTDHISPAGAIKQDSPAGKYLSERQVAAAEFNSYGSRRGNHDVMMRGTFANIRIRNQILSDIEGGYTRHYPSGEEMSIYDAAVRYAAEGVPLVVFAGKEYGTGSSRDWAAKGTRLLGIRAVIATSFERIHRSNLIGMGVLPLTFIDDASWQALGIKGDEQISIAGLSEIEPRGMVSMQITKEEEASVTDVPLQVRIDTADELAYWKDGGILHYVLRKLAGKTS
jgi:aconitate hydratase